MIAAVQIAGASSTNDFVKLFNPTGNVLDISGWSLRKKSSTGTDQSIRQFPNASGVLPGAYFVWANSAGDFSASINADASSTATLAAANSVALVNASGTIVDALAWGSGVNQYGEGNPYPTDPGVNQVLTRIFLNGVPQDTDNNATDFIL
jgi:hypothetical protein